MTKRETTDQRRNRWLVEDVAAMIADCDTLDKEDCENLAKVIITVVRERVLEEIGSFVRQRTGKL